MQGGTEARTELETADSFAELPLAEAAPEKEPEWTPEAAPAAMGDPRVARTRGAAGESGARRRMWVTMTCLGGSFQWPSGLAQAEQARAAAMMEAQVGVMSPACSRMCSKAKRRLRRRTSS